MRWFFYISMVFILSQNSVAQDTIVKKKGKQDRNNSLLNSATKLKKSLDAENTEAVAINYEKLAEELIVAGDKVKAENYLNKAKETYSKLGKTDDAARVTRTIAKLQEEQKRFDDASDSYKAAGEMASSPTEERLNNNDFKRVLGNSTPAVQRGYLNSNIELLEKENKKKELTDAYIQLGEVNLKDNNSQFALESYNQALVLSKNEPLKAVEIQNKIADVYIADKKYDKAIDISQKIVSEAASKNDLKTVVQQKQKLADIYFIQNQPEKAVDELRKAYALAAKSGNTAAVKKSLKALVAYYKTAGNDKEILSIYDDFLQRFDAIIRADTTLIDTKIFQATEEKIQQLEKERALKDELLSRKSRFNYFLMATLVVLGGLMIWIVRALFAIRKKNKEIALQSLRREMNPHFIFNSLNSVNQFIAQNNELEANKYLTNYSTLMRNIMQNSNRDFVPLSVEVEQLKKYLELEHLRFSDRFDFKIQVDDTLDPDAVWVPNMLVQPQLENAIWHGLRYKESKGTLLLSVQQQNDKICIIVDDNGIGLTKSEAIKTTNQKVHASRGMSNTRERIALLNALYRKEITFKVTEKEMPQTGTVVEICLPVITKIEQHD